jgi:hypothetical protein
MVNPSVAFFVAVRGFFGSVCNEALPPQRQPRLAGLLILLVCGASRVSRAVGVCVGLSRVLHPLAGAHIFQPPLRYLWAKSSLNWLGRFPLSAEMLTFAPCLKTISAAFAIGTRSRRKRGVTNLLLFPVANVSHATSRSRPQARIQKATSIP